MEGLTVILDAWHSAAELSDRRWLAYMLATVFHDTAGTMMPSREAGDDLQLARLYDVCGDYPVRARMIGNDAPGDGARYRARGYVRVRGKAHYLAMSGPAGCDLVTDPELLLRPAVACRVMFAGLTVGAFTGYRLADFINAKGCDWAAARRVVSLTGAAPLIPGLAQAFQAALTAAS